MCELRCCGDGLAGWVSESGDEVRSGVVLVGGVECGEGGWECGGCGVSDSILLISSGCSTS